MKILVTDFIFEKAHKDMNINFISAVSKFAECDVVSVNGYYDDTDGILSQIGAHLIKKSIKSGTGVLGYRRYCFRLQRITESIARISNYDAIIILGFETTVATILSLRSFKAPIFLFHHRNIDELTNKVKRSLFDIYKNKVYHVVFEEFFKSRLVNEIGVFVDRVFVVPHPVKPIESVPTEKCYDCIGLCNSNDENFIQEAVDRDSDFQQYGIHILLRSKTLEKKEGAVEVIKGFMGKDIYDELMAAGRTVFVPLPNTYIYRLSGSIYDALSRKKIVYTTSKYYAQEYERRYPGTCKFVGSVDQLIDGLQEKDNKDASASFWKFIAGHSIETVSRDIEEMIETVLQGAGT